MTPAVGLESRNAFTAPKTKKVLPVADSPAKAVTLLFGIPPYMDPLNKAFKIYEPESTVPLKSPADSQSATIEVSSSLRSSTKFLKKSLMITPVLVALLYAMLSYMSTGN